MDGCTGSGEATMVIRPKNPPNCRGGAVTWTGPTDDASLTFGTDCSVWYYVLAWRGHRLRIATVAGQDFPDVHAEMLLTV
jgi:hypothetical protein